MFLCLSLYFNNNFLFLFILLHSLSTEYCVSTLFLFTWITVCTFPISLKPTEGCPAQEMFKLSCLHWKSTSQGNLKDILSEKKMRFFLLLLNYKKWKEKWKRSMWCISSQIIVTQQPLRNTLSLCPCNSKTSKLNCDVYILFRAAKYKKNKMALNCFYRFVWILETNIPWYTIHLELPDLFFSYKLIKQSVSMITWVC